MNTTDKATGIEDGPLLVQSIDDPHVNRPPFPLVRVLWLDAFSDGGWSKAEDEPGDAPCVTIGFLVKKTRKYLRIASTLSRDDEGEWHCNAPFAIPLGMVEEMTTLKGESA